MAFRALLFSKSPETNAVMTAACEGTGIRADVCSDIFTAIEKAKTKAFSCVVADWADQPDRCPPAPAIAASPAMKLWD